MSKYSGKLLTVYISPTGVRVLEGENKTGNPVITRYFTVSGVEEYFTRVSGDISSSEISNMAGLVSAIISECKSRHVTTRRVMVCSDCFGILTTLSTGGNYGGLKDALSADLKDIGKIFKGGGSKDPVPPDKMACDVVWGELPRDGVVKKISTRSMGDKYMLSSLVKEFYLYGYEVIFISGATEVLMNFRHTEECSFDSQGKVVLNIDIGCNATAFYQDLPVNLHSISLLEDTHLTERVTSLVDGCLQHTGRNPRIYLAGSAFRDTNLYEQCIEVLENKGYTVFDLFTHNDLPYNYEELVAAGEVAPVLTADYSANVAMLMCSFAKHCISLTPSLGMSDNLKKNAKVAAIAYLILSAGVLLYMSGLALNTFIAAERMYDNPSGLAELQNKVSSLQMRQNNLQATLHTITQADTLVMDVMKFIVRNQSEDVHIVTMDTSDMLVPIVSIESDDASEEVDTDFELGDFGQGAYLRGSIVIRGYAKTGAAAIAYYDQLFLCNLPIDPVLNGIEKYMLPDGDEVYIFEIEIGERLGGEQLNE